MRGKPGDSSPFQIGVHLIPKQQGQSPGSWPCSHRQFQGCRSTPSKACLLKFWGKIPHIKVKAKKTGLQRQQQSTSPSEPYEVVIISTHILHRRRLKGRVVKKRNTHRSRSHREVVGEAERHQRSGKSTHSVAPCLTSPLFALVAHRHPLPASCPLQVWPGSGNHLPENTPAHLNPRALQKGCEQPTGL